MAGHKLTLTPAPTDHRAQPFDFDAEKDHADRLAQALTFLHHQLAMDRDSDTLHVVMIPGTQITTGQIVEGAMAAHRERRAAQAAFQD